MSGTVGYPAFLERLVREALTNGSDAQIEIEDGNLIITMVSDDRKPFKVWTGNQVGDCVEQLYEGPTLNALYSFLNRRRT